MSTSRILKRLFPSKLFTGDKFRQTSSTHSLTSFVDKFRQASATNYLTTRSTDPPAGSFISRFISNHYRADDDSDSPKSIDDLACALNTMDSVMKVKSAPNPRWTVMEDDKGLYIRRNMAGLEGKDSKESVEFPRGVLRSFLGYRMNDFGSVLLYRGQNPPAILIIEHVGVNGPEPRDVEVELKDGKGLAGVVGEYFVITELPGRFYKTYEIKMAVENQVLKVTIPKEKDKLIPGISFNFLTSLKYVEKVS